MLKTILQILEDAANPILAVGMKVYQKNKFEFYGLTAPTRREICKPILLHCKSLSKKETIDLVKELWNQPQRECHYLAQELLLQNIKKSVEKKDIILLEWLVLNNSWWDTVDFIAPKLISIYFKKFPEERNKITDEWINTKNTWLIRSALLFQLKYKDETDVDFLFATILRVCHTKEFFINKAIGWMLRENAKQIPDTVSDFIVENKSVLSNLSVREGLKHIGN